MKRIILVFIALLYPSCAFGLEARDAEAVVAASDSSFLVKMTSSISTTSSKPGDVITGEVIDPGELRGAMVEGGIERADRAILSFSFQTLRLGGKTFPIQSRLVSITSSKGNEGQDDLGQRVRIEGVGIIAYGVTTALDEGAEVRLSVWKK
jgi:hypothetical protein